MATTEIAFFQLRNPVWSGPDLADELRRERLTFSPSGRNEIRRDGKDDLTSALFTLPPAWAVYAVVLGAAGNATYDVAKAGFKRALERFRTSQAEEFAWDDILPDRTSKPTALYECDCGAWVKVPVGPGRQHFDCKCGRSYDFVFPELP